MKRAWLTTRRLAVHIRRRGLVPKAIFVARHRTGPGSCRSRSRPHPRRWGPGGSRGPTRLPSVDLVAQSRISASWSCSSGFGNCRVGPCHGGVEPSQADVVGPSLDQDRRELLRHHRPQEREIFLEELLLEADCVGRDDHLLPADSAAARIAGTR